MGGLLHMITFDLLFSFQFSTGFANHETIYHVKEWLTIQFKVDQLRVIIVGSLGTTECQQTCVFHLQNGYNGLEKQLGINVRSFIDDDDIGTSSTSSL
jgi:hypothetical protein